MKKRVIVGAIFTSISFASFAQEGVRQIEQSRLLTPEQIMKIQAENPGVNVSSGTTRVLPGPAGSGALVIEDEASLARSAANISSVSSKGLFSAVGAEDVNKGAVLEGYARDLPLVEVLKQIIPEGWKATAVKNAPVNQKVSWQGGQTWDKTLQKITEDNGLNITLNWNEKTVRVLDTAEIVAVRRATERVSIIDFGTATVGTPVGAVSGLYLKNWKVVSGSLKENLETWAEASNFKLVYPDTVANYSVPDFLINNVALDGENGALAQLASRFVEGKVKQPLEFDFKTGGTTPVLVVRNRNYEQKFFKETPKADLEAD